MQLAERITLCVDSFDRLRALLNREEKSGTDRDTPSSIFIERQLRSAMGLPKSDGRIIVPANSQ
jgi:hypothetical protein